MIGAKRGFTLMEVLVVVAIFSVVTVALVNIFLLSNRAQQKTQATESLHRVAVQVMNRIAADIRRSGLDYAPYIAQSTDLSQPVGLLFLAEPARTYAAATTGCVDAASTPCLQVAEKDAVSGAFVSETMTPAGVQVEQFSVWITPTQDPYALVAGTGTYASDTPVIVTVLLELRGGGANASIVRLQQTITMRRYVR